MKDNSNNTVNELINIINFDNNDNLKHLDEYLKLNEKNSLKVIKNGLLNKHLLSLISMSKNNCDFNEINFILLINKFLEDKKNKIDNNLIIDYYNLSENINEEYLDAFYIKDENLESVFGYNGIKNNTSIYLILKKNDFFNSKNDKSLINKIIANTYLYGKRTNGVNNEFYLDIIDLLKKDLGNAINKNIIYLFKSNNILNDLNFLRQDLKLPINKILKIILMNFVYIETENNESGYFIEKLNELFEYKDKEFVYDLFDELVNKLDINDFKNELSELFVDNQVYVKTFYINKIKDILSYKLFTVDNENRNVINNLNVFNYIKFYLYTLNSVIKNDKDFYKKINEFHGLIDYFKDEYNFKFFSSLPKSMNLSYQNSDVFDCNKNSFTLFNNAILKPLKTRNNDENNVILHYFLRSNFFEYYNNNFKKEKLNFEKELNLVYALVSNESKTSILKEEFYSLFGKIPLSEKNVNIITNKNENNCLNIFLKHAVRKMINEFSFHNKHELTELFGRLLDVNDDSLLFDYITIVKNKMNVYDIDYYNKRKDIWFKNQEMLSVLKMFGLLKFNDFSTILYKELKDRNLIYKDDIESIVLGGHLNKAEILYLNKNFDINIADIKIKFKNNNLNLENFIFENIAMLSTMYKNKKDNLIEVLDYFINQKEEIDIKTVFNFLNSYTINNINFNFIDLIKSKCNFDLVNSVYENNSTLNILVKNILLNKHNSNDDYQNLLYLFNNFNFEFKNNKNETHLNKILNDTLIDIYIKQYENNSINDKWNELYQNIYEKIIISNINKEKIYFFNESAFDKLNIKNCNNDDNSLLHLFVTNLLKNDNTKKIIIKEIFTNNYSNNSYLNKLSLILLNNNINLNETINLYIKPKISQQITNDEYENIYIEMFENFSSMFKNKNALKPLKSIYIYEHNNGNIYDSIINDKVYLKLSLFDLIVFNFYLDKDFQEYFHNLNNKKLNVNFENILKMLCKFNFDNKENLVDFILANYSTENSNMKKIFSFNNNINDELIECLNHLVINNKSIDKINKIEEIINKVKVVDGFRVKPNKKIKL